MRRFLRHIALLASLLVAVAAALLCVPPDANGYLSAYPRKLSWLARCRQPRVVLVGGSNLAFGVDSRLIGDSLHCQVANMGLHGGLGARLQIGDVVPRLNRGDVLVVAIEYGNYFSGGWGEPETLPQLMAAEHWRGLGRLHRQQWAVVAAGIPRLAAVNAKRVVAAAWRGGLDTPPAGEVFRYAASGFNAWGDEVSHWRLPPPALTPSPPPAGARVVDSDFVHWLCGTLRACRQRGVEVVMLPPVCPAGHFAVVYDAAIDSVLQEAGLPYAVVPQAMTVPDSMTFDGGYHVDRHGVEVSTARIIDALRHHTRQYRHGDDSQPTQ